MGPSLLLILLVLVQTADGFQSHSVSRCLFNSTELKDSRYIYCNIGLYVGYTSFGMRQANNLNNNPVALSRRRAQKEAFCHHNSGVLYRNVLNRSVAPSVTLSSVAPPAGGHPAMLTCSVYGFFPKQIRVTWRRDGQEVTSDVTSTAELPDGAWLYQIHSSLEFRPRSGERISCRVEHVSLKEPLITDWDPSLPESERNKLAIGASGLILGLILSLAGFIYYKRKVKDQNQNQNTFRTRTRTWIGPEPGLV